MMLTRKTGYPSIDKPWLHYYTNEQIINCNKDIEPISVWSFIERELNNNSNFVAMEYFGTKFTRKQFVENVYRWAKCFIDLGVVEDEVIPVYSPNFPDLFFMTCALIHIGAVPYFLKISISEKALEDETSKSKIAVVYEEMWSNVSAVFRKERFKKIIFVKTTDYMPLKLKAFFKLKNITRKKVVKDNKYVYASNLMHKYKKIFERVPSALYDENRTAVITSSSGTTNKSYVKGIMTTNKAAIAQLYQAKYSGVDFSVGGRCLTNFPLTASTAMNVLFLWCLYMGVTIVVDPRVGEKEFVEQMMIYKPQVTVMTGCWWLSFFRTIEKRIQRGEKIDLSFLHMPTVGGDGVSVKELNWMNRILRQCNSKTPMFCGYGMSEVFSTISIDLLNCHEDIVRDKEIASVGIPYPGVVIGIFDKDGNELPYNTRGELWIKAKSHMKGYYEKKELTEKTLCGEWVKTGDFAEISPVGELFVWGRMENYILVKDSPVYLFDIEKCIRDIDEVMNVKVVKTEKDIDNLDPIMISIFSGRTIHWAALLRLFQGKESLFNESASTKEMKLFSHFITLMGALPIARQDDERYQEINMSSINELTELLKNDRAVGFFPEGTRNRRVEERSLLPIKSNRVFRIACDTESFLVPFSISWSRERHVTIVFSKPINTRKRNKKDVRDIWLQDEETTLKQLDKNMTRSIMLHNM